MIEITVDSGPLWLQYIVAFGTLGAAAFAGWAAWSARSSTAETRRLVQLELDRDARAVQEAEWRQPRRVALDLRGDIHPLNNGRYAHDMHLIVLNTGDDPIRNCRLKITSGGRTWGPQPVGTIVPHSHVTIVARIISDSDKSSDQNGHAWFRDVEGRYWTSEARGSVVREDEESLQNWINEGSEFATRHREPEERWNQSGVHVYADFDTLLNADPNSDVIGTAIRVTSQRQH